jgi:hypothetical protein
MVESSLGNTLHCFDGAFVGTMFFADQQVNTDQGNKIDDAPVDPCQV